MRREHKEGHTRTFATGYLTKFKGQSAYFSLTGEQYEYQRLVCCGCIHEELLRIWPDLKPLVDLHLSDINGVPTHAAANGWYWMGRTKYQSFDRDAVAKHFRILPCEADILRESIETQEQLQAWVDEQKPRWKAEADAAIRQFDLKIVEA